MLFAIQYYCDLLFNGISINLLFTALPETKPRSSRQKLNPRKNKNLHNTNPAKPVTNEPSSSPDHPIGSPGSIPMRCYLPRAADSLRPAARRFFSQATSGTANNGAPTTTATTGKYYFSDIVKARDLNNNNNNSSAPTSNQKNKNKKDKKAAKGSSKDVPSRWYTVLALPFPDQTVGRRDILGTAYGRRRRQQLEQHHQQREDERPRFLRPKKSTPSPALSPSPQTATSITTSKASNIRLFSNSAELSDSVVSSLAVSPQFYRRPSTIEYYRRPDSQSTL